MTNVYAVVLLSIDSMNYIDWDVRAVSVPKTTKIMAEKVRSTEPTGGDGVNVLIKSDPE